MKLTYREFEIEGDAQAIRNAMPILGGLATRATVELRGEEPSALPAPEAADPSPPTPAACCGEPLPPKPRRQYKPRKPKDDPQERPRAGRRAVESDNGNDSDNGPIRVNTGRSKEREMLDALRKHGPCGASRLAAMVGGGVSSAAMYQRLLSLMGKGLVQKGDQAGTFQVIDE